MPNMQHILPNQAECDDIMVAVLDAMKYTMAKRKDLEEGYIKSATFAKFEKSFAILLMDIANVKRYVEDDVLWYTDFRLEKNVKNSSARTDLIDHYLRTKMTDLFVRIFSLFEDALSRILKEEGVEVKSLGFERMVKELKNKSLAIKDDRRFCRFAMHIRNTIHNNARFNAQDQRFEEILNEGPFIFKENGIVDFLSTRRLIKWSRELVDIFERIILSSKVIDSLKDNSMREDL